MNCPLAFPHESQTMSVTRTANKYNLCNVTSVQIREYARLLVSIISVYYVFTSQAAQTKGIAREHTEWKCLLTKKKPHRKHKTLNYDQFALLKTRIMLQKTLKYKLATIKLAIYNSFWCVHIMGSVLTWTVKFISKGNANMLQSPDCFMAVTIRCLLGRKCAVSPTRQ